MLLERMTRLHPHRPPFTGALDLNGLADATPKSACSPVGCAPLFDPAGVSFLASAARRSTTWRGR